jgi:hypothetical protein
MRTATMFCLTAAVFLLAGCGDTRDNLMEQNLALMNEFGDVLASVKDEASAKAAEARIKSIGERLEALRKRSDALGKISADEEKALKGRWEAKAQASGERMFKEMGRIMTDPKLGPLLRDAVQKIRPAGE